MEEETLKILKNCNKSEKDVLWCGSAEFGWFTWEDFIAIAPEEYDNGFGSQEIAKDLLVVGDNWWLERHEYDGSEWWEYKTIPQKPEKYVKPTTICNGGMWETLTEMNNPT